MFFQLIKQLKRSRSSSLAKAVEQRIQVFQGVHTFFSDPGNNNSFTVNLDPVYCREPVFCGKASSFENICRNILLDLFVVWPDILSS